MKSDIKFPFPNDFVHALLAAHCANKTEQTSPDFLPKPGDQAKFSETSSLLEFFQQEKKIDLNRLIANWKIKKVLHDLDTQYIGILYVEETAKQAVLVHRSTDLNKSIRNGFFKKSSLQADIEGILMGRILDHQFRGYEATYEAVQFIKDNPSYQLSFAGHSLGSSLAQLSLLYCHTDFKFSNTKAITFDGPGSYEMIKQLRQSEIKGAGSTFNKNELDIVSYFSAPNFVNCTNKHVGNCYRLFTDIQSPQFMENKFVKWLIGSKKDALLSLKGHDIEYILPFFDEATGRPVCEKVIQWPLITHKEFGHSQEKLFKKHFNEAAQKKSEGFVSKILKKIIKFEDSVLFKLFCPESSTIGSLIYFLKDLLNGKISQDQFWIAHTYLDRQNQYRAKSTDLKIKFDLPYKGGYQVEPYYSYSRQVKDNIDEMLKNLTLKEHHTFIADQTFLALVLWIRDRYVYLQSKNSLEIKEQFRSEITISQLRDLTRTLNKDSFDKYMIQAKLLHRLDPRKIIYEAGKNLLVRQNEIDKIRQKLSKNNVIAISGERGFGKSALAHCYALELEKSNVIPIEFNAAEGKLLEEYRNYADSLNWEIKNKTKEAILRLVHHELRKSGKQILLIYDNVEKIEDILLYISHLPQNAKLIITTQDFYLLEQHNLTIGPFTEIEVQQYLKQNLPLITNNEIKETIRLIGCIPQNLAIMISYLKSNRSESIKEYLNNLPNRKGTVYTELFRMISDKQPKAWKLLQNLAYLDPDYVPLKLLQRITDRKIAESLGKHFLIRWIEKEGYRGVRIHRELQHQVKIYCTNNGQTYAIKRILTELLSIFYDLFPLIDANPDEKWKEASLLSSNVKAFIQEMKLSNLKNQEMEKVAELYSYIGQFEAKKNSNFEKSKDYQIQALLIRQRLFPGDHPHVAISLNNVGITYKSLGNIRIALQYHQKALMMRQRLFHGDHPDVAFSLNNVGTTYESLGETKTGLQYQEQALMMRQKLFAGDHPDVASSLNNVGTAYQSLGEIKTALQYLEQALLMRQRLFLNDHPDVAISLNNVGTAYALFDNITTALRYHKKALMMRQRLFPGDHPDITTSLNSLGRTYKSLGDIKTALQYHQQALMMRQRLFYGDHPDVASSLNNVGTTYESLGETKTGLQYQEQALMMRQKLFAGDHPDVASSLNNVGTAYQSLGEIKTALQYLEQALLMRQRLFPSNHTDVAVSFNNVALAYGSLGDIKKSLYYRFQAYSIKKQLNLPISSLRKTINSLLKQCGVASSFDTLVAKLNLLVPTTSPTEDLISLKLLLQPDPFIFVQKKSAEGKWKNYNIFTYLFSETVEHIVSTERLKQQLNSSWNASNVEEAQMLYFEAISLGIVFSDKQNLECAFQFAKAFPELLIKIAREHPNYFVDRMIVEQLKSHGLISEEAYEHAFRAFK